MNSQYKLTYEEVIRIPCKILRTYPEGVIESAINTVIDHYYEVGFPYYDSSKRKKEFLSLREFDSKRLLMDGNILQQFMLGLNTVNSYHPEMWHVRCKNAKTPYEIFQDRGLFYTALRKRVKYSDTKLVDYNVRKSLRAFGVQSVSNFRPTIAKWVYDNYATKFGRVLDPCAGYGGRLMGAMCSDNKVVYHGIDPNRTTQLNNAQMAQDFTELGSSASAVLDVIPFEDTDMRGKYELVFTSPPYFNIEKYSDEDTQSWVRYPDYQVWVDKFLRQLILKSYACLERGGHLVLNVGNPIVDDTLSIANGIFGEPVTYHMRLSKILGKGDKSDTSHKTEPIFIWKK